MWIRYGALVLLTGAVGVLSGLLWLIPNGLMGGVLGMCLSLGTIWLGRMQTRQHGELALRQVLPAGFGVGLLAGVLMAAISEWAAGRKRGDFSPPELPFWMPLLMGVAYGIVIHWNYWRRRFSRHPLLATFTRTAGFCFLVKALGMSLCFILMEKKRDTAGVLVESVMTALLGAVPFALLWVWMTARLDPAWSSPHWPAATQGPAPQPPRDG